MIGSRNSVTGRSGRDVDNGRDVLPQLFGRLEDALALENEALRSRSLEDIDVHIERKNHALLELGRAINKLSEDELRARAGHLIPKLREAVNANHELLQRNMEAVRSIAEIVRVSIQEAESDGTYSHQEAVARGRP